MKQWTYFIYFTFTCLKVYIDLFLSLDFFPQVHLMHSVVLVSGVQ